jgi:hypothetical protein
MCGNISKNAADGTERSIFTTTKEKIIVRIYFSTAHHPSALSFFHKLTYRVQDLSTVRAS